MEKKAELKLEPIREASAVLYYKGKQFIAIEHAVAFADIEHWRSEHEGATEKLSAEEGNKIYETAGFLTESGKYVDAVQAADHARANHQMANPKAKKLESEYFRSPGRKLG